jgi:hypothetical protein
MTLEQKAWELFIKNLKMPLASPHVKILANECFSIAQDFEYVAGNYQSSQTEKSPTRPHGSHVTEPQRSRS